MIIHNRISAISTEFLFTSNHKTLSTLTDKEMCALQSGGGTKLLKLG